MFLRHAALTGAVTLGGAAFLAGLAAGAGLAAAGVGAACLARRAMKKKGEWRDTAGAEASESAMPDKGESSPA